MIRAEPTIGLCGNRFRGERTDWADSRNCNNPAVDIGDPAVRNQCTACAVRSQHFGRDLVDQFTANLSPQGAAEWMVTATEIIAGTENLRMRMLADGRRREARELDTDLRRRERIVDAVLAAFPSLLEHYT